MTLERAYRATVYGADTFTVRVGRRSPVPAAGGFVTAWNPRSRRMPPGWNARANRRLQARVRRLPHWAGWGEGQGWREAHLYVAADPRRLLVLARLFRQSAIVVAAPRRPARLVWVDRA